MVDQNVNAHPHNNQNEDTPGVRRRVLTLDRIKSYALARYGYPKVTVEIDPMQMGVFWEKTLDEYNKWLPLIKRDVLTAVSSTLNKYNLRSLNKPFGRGVVDVRIASKQQFFSPISGVFALGIPHPISHLSPDQYQLALEYIYASKKIYSSEPDWEWEEPVMWLYAPTGFGGPFIAAYQYHQDVSDPESVPQEDWSWVMEYFSTLVKEAIGEARGKFGTIPGPAGQTLRGVEMVTQALDQREKLELEIQSKSYCRVPPLGPNSVG